ncbi:hypothetical protein DMB65_09120 [Flavobacterium cheongpyeongense]|jgi:hypothetical protein|uniref:Uncharacterized protein n=1 Tax=Flavobacterium cheongpyeongense TaxID=2212651 RepID=A0A2V4C4I7_9FLAO|nr:hypothetical protein [Flavobacterium cheongpyeongense]PXY41104.1 hypothetical protein DMB65_09120 [Flavobacterium cheongpyeongense]
MVNISVTVFGGLPPLPIKVIIDNLDNNHDIKFSRNNSFSEDYILPPGRYMIIISGMNPSGGKTEMHVHGDFSEGPLPTDEKTTEKTYYSQLFYGVISN